jgi:hypothetical protein
MRCTIERAFGVFEIRFQIFQRRILQEPERATEIVACCIRLHNICMMANDRTPLEGSSAYDAQDEVAEPAPHGVAFNNRDTKLRTFMVKLVEDLGYIRPGLMINICKYYIYNLYVICFMCTTPNVCPYEYFVCFQFLRIATPLNSKLRTHVKLVRDLGYVRPPY